MANYYIKQGGNDTLNGLSYANAWASVSKLNTVTLQAGDNVYFDGNLTCSVRIDLLQSGAPGSPILLTSYNLSAKATITFAQNTSCFRIFNASWYTLKDFNVVGGGINHSSTTEYGGVEIHMWNSPVDHGNIMVDGVNVSNINGDGMGIYGGQDDGSPGVYRNVTFQNLTISGCVNGLGAWHDDGVALHENITVRNVTTVNNTGRTSRSDVNGSGIVMCMVKNSLIENCYASGNGTMGKGGVGIWYFVASDSIIQNCTSVNNVTTTGTDGGGFDLDGGCVNCIIQYCYSENNYGPGYLVYNDGSGVHSANIVRYNFSINDCRKNGYGAITVGGAGSSSPNRITSAAIYNNTVVLTNAGIVSGTPACFHVMSNVNSVVVRNNHFQTTGSYPLIGYRTSSSSTTANVSFQSNNYHAAGSFIITYLGTNHTSLTAWKSVATTQESGYNNTHNPLFVAAGTGAAYYQLQEGSPLINLGVTVTGNGERDYFGNTVPTDTAADIGAHEYVPPLPPEGPYFTTRGRKILFV